jgi:outer membrane lipoprotein-sorting protein
MPSMAQTVDEIVAKHVQALGGAEKLHALKTKRITARASGGGGPEFPIVLEFSRPDKVRQEVTFQGLTQVVAYDGKIGWIINPFQGKKDAEQMGEDQLKNIQDSSDFDGSYLVDYKEKGHKVTLLGKEPVEGTDAYKLKVNLKNGDEQVVYLDAEEFLEIKSESKQIVRGTETETEAITGDYKEVNGVMVPHALEQGPKGSPSSAKQKFTLEKIEFNVPIADSRFSMPAAAPPAAPEVKKEEPKAEEKKK